MPPEKHAITLASNAMFPIQTRFRQTYPSIHAFRLSATRSSLLTVLSERAVSYFTIAQEGLAIYYPCKWHQRDRDPNRDNQGEEQFGHESIKQEAQIMQRSYTLLVLVSTRQIEQFEGTNAKGT
jgi:hypothetical protein